MTCTHNPRPSTSSIKSDGIARRFLPEKETNMNLTTWMKTTFADALSSSAATQVEVQEPKRKSMRIVNGILTLMIVSLLIVPIALSQDRSLPQEKTAVVF